MKQIFPFILIAVIIGGAMLFLKDDYEEAAEFDPLLTHEEWSQSWMATFFLEEGENEEEYNIGVKLELEREDVEIDAIELFVDTQYGGFFYQDLHIEEFDGMLMYSEACNLCGENTDGYINGNMMLNWKQNGNIRSEYFHFSFNLYHLDLN
ncbi:hypothetical protein ACERII_18020 [Evansella sp. AB-rgal1]|uniref:hypothetical protein n=1 Tax=Evansella sp. AB-rgal1 TaxID=3242696 RepID=UPI00359DB6BA